MIVLAVFWGVLLVIIAAIAPGRSDLSEYELERRIKNGDIHAKDEQRRNELYADVVTFQRVIAAWLLVLVVVALVQALGWIWGVMWALVVSLLYGRIAAFGWLRRGVQKIYDRHEYYVLRFIDVIKIVLRPLRGVFISAHDRRVQSRDELAHIITQAHALLTKNEQNILKNGLLFEARYVRDYMTPRSVIDVVDQKESLGPLVLDSLYKTGHSHFPVIDGDIDHVVGLLNVQDMMTIDQGAKNTQVADVMNRRVCYIHEDQTLEHALNAFIKQKRQLFVVVNEYRETVGILTLEDVMEMLLGRKIVDEFDKHDDLRAVAARNPAKNNLPKNAVNV